MSLNLYPLYSHLTILILKIILHNWNIVNKITARRFSLAKNRVNYFSFFVGGWGACKEINLLETKECVEITAEHTYIISLDD